MKVKLKYDREKLSKRMQTSEHSQGTMKSVDNYTSFHMRGKEKVSCEIAIHFTASNIRRVVNMIGVGKMLEKISEIDQKCGIIEKIKREFLKVRKRYVYVIISF